MLLTVEYNEKGVVEIHCDQEGLESLLTKLGLLKERGGHEHLKTPAWAGYELTEERQGHDNQLINHVKIILWPS